MKARRETTRILVGTALLLVFALAAGLAVGCGGNGDEPADDEPTNTEPIIIGASISETGLMAPWDIPGLAAMEIALDEQNAKGGINGRMLKVIKGDMKSDPNLGVQVTNELIDQGAVLLYTTCDFDSGASSGVAAGERNVPSVALAAGSAKYNLKGAGDYAFSMGNPSAEDGYAAAEFAIHQGWTTCWMIWDEGFDYSKHQARGFKEHYEALGGTVVGTSTFMPDDASIATQVSDMKAKSGEFDCIDISSFPPFGAAAIRQIRAAGLDQPMVTGDGFAGTFWMEAVPDLSDFYGCNYGSLEGDDPRPEYNELVEGVAEKMGEPPLSGNIVCGYSIGQAFIKALEMTDGNTDGKELLKALESLKDEPLLVGPTTFTNTAHSCQGRPYYVNMTQDGKNSFVMKIESSDTPDLSTYVE